MLSWPFSSLSRAALLLAVLLLPMVPAGAQLEEEDYRQKVDAALEGYLRPAISHFEETTEVAQAAVTRLCAEPSAAALQTARAAFGEAALAWAAIEYIDLDPWQEENRGTSIYFFPDRRGVTGRHLRAALQKADPALLQPETIAVYSVALQGLPALEYLLYGKGFDALIEGDGADYRCALTQAVAGNLLRLAGALQAAWAPSAPFPQALANPEPDNVFVRSHKEAATLLLGRVSTGLEAMIQRKVSAPLGADLETARPLRAAYALSGMTNEALAANLLGFRALQTAASMTEAMSLAEVAALEQAYTKALLAIVALPEPLGQAAADPFLRSRVQALQADLQVLHRLAGLEVLAALGLKVFFSADDGD